MVPHQETRQGHQHRDAVRLPRRRALEHGELRQPLQPLLHVVAVRVGAQRGPRGGGLQGHAAAGLDSAV
jgi:hypothetical protein